MTAPQPRPTVPFPKALATDRPADPALPRPWAGLPTEMRQPLAQQFARLLLRLRAPQPASPQEKSHDGHAPGP